MVVADFGIAHFEEDFLLDAVETVTGERLANWEYAAPEQRRKGQAVDQRADIYSLGLILNELFTNEVPHGANPRTIASSAPDFSYLDEIADSMRQNAPQNRPQSIAEIKSRLLLKGNEFVKEQQLDALRKTVIPTSEKSDPLIDNPIDLRDVEYQNGSLVFSLSARPNERWKQHFYNMGSYSAIMGSGPERFSFVDVKANVPVQESAAQQVVHHFVNYIKQTNTLYAGGLRSEWARAKEVAEKQLRDRIERETRDAEVTKRMKATLKW